MDTKAIGEICAGYRELVGSLSAHQTALNEVEAEFLRSVLAHGKETNDADLLQLVVDFLTRQSAVNKTHRAIMEVLAERVEHI